MRVGEAIATYDLALALRGESGEFEVTSPTGETYAVYCNSQHSISIAEYGRDVLGQRPFLVRKVSGMRSENQGTGVAHQPTSTLVPFRVAVADEKTESMSDESAIPMSSDLIKTAIENADSATLELFYLQTDSFANEAPVSVSVKSGTQSGRPLMLTPACVTFNELDAAIRKLHARLDELRIQARKKFYKAQAASAGG